MVMDENWTEGRVAPVGGDWKTRLRQEHSELKKRVEKLLEFVSTDRWQELSEEEQRDLQDQSLAMGSYLKILERRLSRVDSDNS